MQERIEALRLQAERMNAARAHLEHVLSHHRDHASRRTAVITTKRRSCTAIRLGNELMPASLLSIGEKMGCCRWPAPARLSA